MYAINTFMRRIIDYAGLFPPAKLPMPAVVRDFAEFRAGPHADLVDRIICPVARFDEFAEHVSKILDSGAGGPYPWRVSALGGGGPDVEGFRQAVDADFMSIAMLVERLSGRIVVDAYECRVPDTLILSEQCATLTRLADRVALAADHRLSGEIRPFFEVPFLDDWQQNTPRAIAAVAEHNRGLATPMCRPAGVKIRTGGVTADLFPSTRQVASFIAACHKHGVRFKATAGLHHPVRHHSPHLDTRMHGFFNVFSAAILTQVHDLDLPEIVDILEDEDPASFRWSDNCLAWRDRSISTEMIASARRDFATSFGSCSMIEPVDDLQGLKLLDGPAGAGARRSTAESR